VRPNIKTGTTTFPPHDIPPPLQRIEEGRLPTKVMKWSPPGRRKRGRPKATWTEGIGGMMGEKGLIEEDWQDRDKWEKKSR